MTRAAPSSPRTDPVFLSAAEIAHLIANEQLTSCEAVDAHIRRIEVVNPRLNAVVVPLFEQARAEARAADAKQQRGEPLGPLHGVPITVKECYHVAGTPSSIGVHQFANELLPTDGVLVRRLRAAGAILLGKTNVPQLMILHETDNPVYGPTNNPWDLGRSPGGSSGGEAAIIAAGGSALGLGSDLGGSIRQPAHSCGIHGFKPTTGRLSILGSRNALNGMTAIGLQPGPLARSVADLELALRVLANSDDDLDPQVPPAPLGDSADVSIAGLRIGFWTDDGYFPAAPAIRRAVNEAAEALRQAGATVEPWQPPDVAAAVHIYFSLVGADGGADLRRLMGDSTCDWRLKHLLRIGGLPRPLRSTLTAVLSLAGQRRSAELVGFAARTSADRYWQTNFSQSQYTQRFMAAMAAARLDALVFPPHALPALEHGSSIYLHAAGSYCYLPNLLGIPAGVVAASRVRGDEESDRPESRDLVEKTAKIAEVGSVGLPVGVQVAARHWREDIVLAIMARLEAFFRTQADYPSRPVID